MIRASGLYGRAIVDLDTADRVGYVDEIIVDPYGPCIAGFVVTAGRSVLGSRKHSIIPSEAIYAIGRDVLTMRSGGRPPDETVYLSSLPRLSDLTGRKLISFGGKFLGTVEDALIDERDGRIIGYPLDGGSFSSGLERMFSLGLRPERNEYVRANADLRVGARLIVVPDDAVASMDEEELPALTEGTHAAVEQDDLTPLAATSEREAAPERKAPAPRHHRMAIPFAEAEHEGLLTPHHDGLVITSEEPSPTDDHEEALDDDLVATSQIRATTITGRSRRSRTDRLDSTEHEAAAG